MKTAIIIGAGASGLACAVNLKRNEPLLNVIVLERMSTPGKKILATGNGRCNFSNVEAYRANTVIDFFESIGLRERTDDAGRIYPYSNRADTVLQILLDECERLGVTIITDCNVRRIGKSLTVTADICVFSGDFVVVATGGMAQEKLGSNGSGYALLEKHGHKITEPRPALVPLTSSTETAKMLSGQRVKCRLSLYIDDRREQIETGEVLFTDYGLSGIAVMNVSQKVSKYFLNDKKGRNGKKKCYVLLDLAPEMSSDELVKHIEKFGSLNGIFGKRISDIIMVSASNNPKRAANTAKHWKFVITGTKGFDKAQITYGGAATSEFVGYESIYTKNLFACGEVLDVQYKCGGFNLNNAFYSGICVSEHILNRIKYPSTKGKWIDEAELEKIKAAKKNRTSAEKAADRSERDREKSESVNALKARAQSRKAAALRKY